MGVTVQEDVALLQGRKMCAVAGVFALFQALMPLLGWVCVHTVLEHFRAFEKFIPWIALALLGWIGGKMLLEGLRNEETPEETGGVGLVALLVQGVATSIDALSVGFTIAEYDVVMALVCAAIIAVVTFAICLGGLAIGKKFGTKLAGKESEMILCLPKQGAIPGLLDTDVVEITCTVKDGE